MHKLRCAIPNKSNMPVSYSAIHFTECSEYSLKLSQTYITISNYFKQLFQIIFKINQKHSCIHKRSYTVKLIHWNREVRRFFNEISLATRYYVFTVRVQIQAY